MAIENLRQLIRKTSYRACSIGMLMVIPLAALTVADAAGRFCFDTPLPGSFELSEYFLAVVVLTGAAYTQQVKGHVAVDLVTDRCSARVRAVIASVTGMASLFIVAVLVWQGAAAGMVETTVSDQLRIPQWPFRLLAAAGCLLLWLELFLDWVDALRTAFAGGRWTR
ncbi:MAG: TRAP transporter small permease [Desulfobacterales bacterium]|nr:TRAP transporter small permease [Desulfobacterales bacterium]